MLVPKLISLFYIAITILLLIIPIEASYSDRIPGLLFMWAIYFLFKIGTIGKIGYKSIRNYSNSDLFIESLRGKRIIIMSIVLFLFSMQYIKFYTGSNPYQAVINYSMQNSTYAAYQEHFADSGLGVFSVAKLPYIIGMGVYKFLFWLVTIYSFCVRKRWCFSYLFAILLLTLGLIISAIARGTFFEIFEISFLFLYVYLFRQYDKKRERFMINGIKILKITGLLFIILILFAYNKSLRYADGVETMLRTDSGIRAMNLDKDSFLYQNLPFFTSLIHQISGYFLFGPYFISLATNMLWTQDIFTVSAFSLPLPSFFLDISSRNYIGSQIYLGPTWNPDFVKLVDYFGFILSFCLVYGLGTYYRRMLRKMHGVLSALISYVILLTLFSLPIGNFIIASSSNIIAVLLILIMVLYSSNSGLKNKI